MTPTHRAAGILFRTPDGSALFLKRGPGGDYPGYWCFPGGHAEESDGSLEASACREAVEEIGHLPKGKREVLARSITAIELPAPAGSADGAAEGGALPPGAAPKVVDFTTFSQEVPEPFDVVRDAEHVGFAWAPCSEPPEPLHPGCRTALARLFADELGVARMIADGRLTSPQLYKNVTLWAMRITGTGVSYRTPVFKEDAKGKVVLGADGKAVVDREEEFPWRDPELYLNAEFLARCNGLPVVWKHPKKGTLDSKEFENRVVGTVFLPFVRGDEVWGVAKVFDDAANAMLAAGKEDGTDWSTSPAVVLSDPANPSYKFKLEDGATLLVEGKPSLLDHLAICERGVWDKGGEPAGIINSTERTDSMAEKVEEVKADAAKEPTMSEVLAAIGSVANSVTGLGEKVAAVGARMDAFEKDDGKKADGEDEKDKKADGEDEKDKKADGEDEKDKKADGEDEKGKKADGDDCPEKVAADAKADAAFARSDASAARGEAEALRGRLAAVEAKLPQDRSDDDHRTMSSAQARADSVYGLFGEQAPRFLTGEAIGAYRRRLVDRFKSLSASWKSVDLATLPDAAFSIAEDAVYADASVAARDPITVGDVGLRMVPGRTPAGHQKIEFFGDSAHFVGHFAGQRRYATRINPIRSQQGVH